MKYNFYLMNGPPGCGKDYAVKAFTSYVRMSFATAVKDGTHEHYKLACSTDAFENCKDKYTDIFGMTPREAYKDYAEVQIKPVKGSDYFGNFLGNTFNQHHQSFEGVKSIVITDAGFKDEVLAFLETVKEHINTVSLIRIHRNKHTFKDDSRSYLHIAKDVDPEMDYTELWCVNEGDDDSYLDVIKKRVKDSYFDVVKPSIKEVES